MSEKEPALLTAAKRGITPFELRLDQEAFQRGVEYALKHKVQSSSSGGVVSATPNDIVPGTGAARHYSDSIVYRKGAVTTYMVEKSKTGTRRAFAWRKNTGWEEVNYRVLSLRDIDEFPVV